MWKSVLLVALSGCQWWVTDSDIMPLYDQDNDGYDAPEAANANAAGPWDCDDADPEIHPGAVEHCDGQDEDCDGSTDDNPIDALSWFADNDGDQHGAGQPAVLCSAPEGFVQTADDCDDARPDVHPGITEICLNGLDDDCDGLVDQCALGKEDATAAVVLGSSADIRAVDVRSVEGAGQLALVADPSMDVSVARMVALPLSGTDVFDLSSSLLVRAPYRDRIASVAVGADFDHDGWPDLVLGATEGGSGGGGVYVISHESGDVVEAAYASYWADETNELAGEAVAASGDLSGDGEPDLVVGAPGDAYGIAGAVYVVSSPFTAGGHSLEGAARTRVLGTSDDEFGISVNVNDLDGDGTPDLVAGTAAAGYVAVFRGPLPEGQLWTSYADQVVRSTTDTFGDRLVTGDVDGDGNVDLVAADWQSSYVETFLGGAELTLPLQAHIAGLASQDQFGFSLACSAPAASPAWLAIGAPNLNAGWDATGLGALYIFPSGVEGTLSAADASLTMSNDEPYSYPLGDRSFGGDFDGDGTADLAVVDSEVRLFYGLE